MSPRPSSTPAASTQDWDVAVGTGLLRLAAGAALLRWRDPVIRLAGGSDDDLVLRGLFTYFGVRDLAVGIATLATTRPGRDPRRALLLQGAADGTDTLLLTGLLSQERVPRVRGIGMVALAAGTAAVEFATARRLRRSR